MAMIGMRTGHFCDRVIFDPYKQFIFGTADLFAGKEHGEGPSPREHLAFYASLNLSLRLITLAA
jgi:hypothetical protein